MVLRKSRLKVKTSKLFDDFTSSISFDHKLCRQDIIGSLAHVNMLAKTAILTTPDAIKIQEGLLKIYQEYLNNEIHFDSEYEDIHMNIEKLLTDKLGDLAGKMHTARSRNDQVILDEKLFLREAIYEVCTLLLELISTLRDLAVEYQDQIVPGYTHLQRAQPVLLSHQLLAYAFKFEHDLSRFYDSFERANLCPLGAGALAGSGFSIDRFYVAKLLKFSKPSANSMDTVSDRDYLLEFLSNSAIFFTHLSGFSEELIIWSATEFNFVDLPDDFCTTSSMMPQKKNPDLAELLRGKSGRINGNLVSLLTTLKGLSLTYFKDLQEDKEPFFDSYETVTISIQLMSAMLKGTSFNRERMNQVVEADYSNATDLADYLASKGLSFRKAHEIAGELVALANEKKVYLKDLSLSDLQDKSELFAEDIYEYILPVNVINRRKIYGSTGPESVAQQIEELSQYLVDTKDQLDNLKLAININPEDLLIV